MANITPLDGRVVLKGVAAEETTKSGIYLPGNDKEKPKVFEVVAVSTGRVMENGTTRPHALKVGDKVVCSSYAGDDIKLEEEEFKVISEDSVLAIIQ